MPNTPDMETLTYWVTRLEPLIRAEDTNGEIIVVFANRTGIEGDATYAGTSAVIGIENGEVKVYGLLGRGEKELLVVDTSQTPYGKLIYRPDSLSKADVPDGETHNSTSSFSEPDYQTGGTSVQDSRPPGESAPEPGSPRAQTSDHQEPKKTSVLGNRGPTPVAGQAIGCSPTGTNQIMDLGYKQDAQVIKTSQGASGDGPKETAAAAETRKPIAPITVPSNSSSVAADVKSPKGEGTPTTTDAPLRSPRMAVRPKLVIPQSPNMIPQQTYPDQPISAASALSGKSIQSMKSNDSEASVKTVTSNPRPPEDSTPYPHSGMPLSGYPRKKKIYGGFVTINSVDQVPITPFEDLSPMSAMSWGWPHSANPFSTPNSAGGWPTRTPIGTAPEPFPWAALRGGSRPRSRSTSRLNRANVAVRKPTPPATSFYNSVQSPEPETAVHMWNPSIDTPQLESGSGRHSARPPSPKSRNASRSRTHERSDSAAGTPDFSAAARHLEDVSKRVNSVSRTGKTPQSGGSGSQTDSLPDQANDIPNKDAYMFTVADSQTVMMPIMASSSLMTQETPRSMMVPTPVALDYYRSASNSVRLHSPLSTKRSAPTPSSGAQTNAIERSPSRGRQRAPKHSPVHSGHRDERDVRSTSIDSTRNDLLHRHVSRASANGGSQGGRNHNIIQLPEGYSAEDFERVEAVACPNCPVHGRRSRSASNPAGHVSGWRVLSQNRSRRRRSTSQARAAPFSSPAPEMIQIRSRKAGKAKAQTEARAIPEPRFAPAPVQRPRKVVDRSKRNGVVSPIASPVARPSTAPLPFNPPTPKAMAYVPAPGELDLPGDDGLALSTTLKGKFVEQDDSLGVQLPATA
ncbi:carbon-nitrogen hydrolase [Cordyceps javanica]|nr:carbon-nitrogen hydrolase [Cordyceps javanica]